MIGLYGSIAGQTFAAAKHLSDEPPHWMAPDTDCMGHPTPGYWRQFLRCSDGYIVIGIGVYAEAATAQAKKMRDDREATLKLPPIERLKLLAAGSLCDQEMKEAIRLLIQLLVKK